MKELWTSDLSRLENQSIAGWFVAESSQQRTASTGAPYLCVVLADKQGTADGRVWKVENASAFKPDDIVFVQGTACLYKGKPQINIDALSKADPAQEGTAYEIGDFVKTTKEDVNHLWSRLLKCVGGFTDSDLRALLTDWFQEPELEARLRTAPAAKALHHAFQGGLLEHIVSLLELGERMARCYPVLNRDLLLAGIILHDIGKLEELRWRINTSYTTEGQLLGHITLGISMVERRLAARPDFPPRLRHLLLHMMLSHHGRLEYGSPKLPMTAEALVLSHLDDLDAKLQLLQSEFAKSLNPGEPTEWVRSMERPLLDSRAYLAGSDS